MSEDTHVELAVHDYNSTLKSVEAVPMKILTVENEELVKKLIPGDVLVEGGMPIPESPKYVKCPNFFDPEGGREIAVPIAQEMHPPVYVEHNDEQLMVRPATMMNVTLTTEPVYCENCQGKHEFTGFKLDVPEWWVYNAVLQCPNCFIVLFVDLVKRGDG